MRLIPFLVLAAGVLVGCSKGNAPAADPSVAPTTNAAPAATATADQSTGADLLDDAALARFRLTTTNVARATEATRNLARLSDADPQLAKRLSDDEGLNDAKSIQQMADRLAAVPQVRRAIESAGISTRDYVLVLFTYTQVAVASVYAQQGRMDKLPANISKDNVAFAAAHRAEMTRFQQAMQQMNDGLANGSTP